MTEDFFKTKMSVIAAEFGGKPFTAERFRMIWHVLKDLPENSFSKIVNHFLSTFRQMPLPKDFIDAAIRERSGVKNRTFNDEGESREPQCQKCCDCGLFEVQQDRTKLIALVRCSCETGANSIHRDLPRWDPFTMGRFFSPLHMGQNSRHLIWRPDIPVNPRDIMGSLEEKMKIWKLKIRESLEFWAAFSGQSGPDVPPPEAS